MHSAQHFTFICLVLLFTGLLFIYVFYCTLHSSVAVLKLCSVIYTRCFIARNPHHSQDYLNAPNTIDYIHVFILIIHTRVKKLYAH